MLIRYAALPRGRISLRPRPNRLTAKRALVTAIVLLLIGLALSWWLASRPRDVSGTMRVDDALEAAWKTLPRGSTTESVVSVPSGQIVVYVGPYTSRKQLAGILPQDQHAAIDGLLRCVGENSPIVAVLDKGRVTAVDYTFTFSGNLGGAAIAWPVVDGKIVITVEKISFPQDHNRDLLKFIERHGAKVAY
jgi:hypothetical protein